MILWNAWTQYSNHSNISKAYRKYKNEKVGSDKELQSMVSILENNLSDRRSIKFKTKVNPFEITKVIPIDGNLVSRGVKGIECSGIITDKDGGIETICTYRATRYVVAVGDSIGGGVVSDISSNKVYIKKNKEDIVLEIY